MQGLHRLTNAANRIEAWKDWKTLAAECIDAGHKGIIDDHIPPSDAGWRKIDKCIASMREELEAAIEYYGGE